MAMYCLLPCWLLVTFCCLVDVSFLLASALVRRRWTASITSPCCARTASPSFWVQSSFVLIIERTSGVATNDLTLSSHFCLSTAAFSSLPLRFLFSLAQRSACTTSNG